MIEQIIDRKQEIKKFVIVDILLSFVVFVCSYQDVLRSYNSTMLALSYRYGFTSRSLLGSIYHLINDILPINMIEYSKALFFAQVVTGLFFVFLIYFSYFILKRCKDELLKPVEFLLIFFDICIIASFSSAYNFFRVDLFMIIVALISAIIIVSDKCIWLLIPLSCIGVMFHQGFVFMYFNVTLILLLYKFFSSEKKDKKKYIMVFIISLIAGSILFLWFEFFSRTNGDEIIDIVKTEASDLSLNGCYHSTLLAHEVLGIDLASDEWEWHKMNIVQYVWFTILMLPYIIIAFKFFKGLLQTANTINEKIKYILIIIGSLTMLPDFLLKIDFGRWVIAVLVYYIVVLLAVSCMNDYIFKEQIIEVYREIYRKPWSFILLMYPILFVPFNDVDIDGIVQQLSAWTNGTILHWYVI